jgi:agmatinase
MTGLSTISPRQAALLLAPVEDTSSFLRGSALGPEAVALELEQLETFDPDVGCALPAETIANQVCLSPADRHLPGAIEVLADQARSLMAQGFFLLTLGGEHTITLGPLEAAVERWPEVGVIQLDAHGDLRQSYEGRPWSHACAMRRAVEAFQLPLLGVGIRSVCPEEVELVGQRPRLCHLSPRQLRSNLKATLLQALESMPRQVYLSIDMDVFDPAVAPGVGTPEAGGLDWEQVVQVIDIVTAHREVVAADLVELAPPVESARTVRLAARLAIRLLLQILGPTRLTQASLGSR